MPDSTPSSNQRILSLDQFRGYTIFGMILVNFLGSFSKIPEFFKHHEDYITYADTIAPLFLFMVGMGFRFSFLRNAQKVGTRRALLSAARRFAILTLVGIVYYNPLDWTQWWDALVDIGFSGLLALPFIPWKAPVRVAGAVGYMILFQVLFVHAGYGTWVMASSFDGGPLGPLSWVFCLLLGTLAYDLIATRDPRKIVLGCLGWGLFLCAVGALFHVEWPGIKAVWPFSQRSMSMPYPVFDTGLCFLAYIPFYLLADRCRIQIPTFTAMGANPLVIYMLHATYIDQHRTIIAEDSAPWRAVLAFAVLYLGCYAVARYLYKNRMFVKI